MSRDRVAERVDEMVRAELVRAEGALERARREHAAAVLVEQRLADRVARLESEVAGWSARVDV